MARTLGGLAAALLLACGGAPFTGGPAEAEAETGGETSLPRWRLPGSSSSAGSVGSGGSGGISEGSSGSGGSSALGGTTALVSGGSPPVAGAAPGSPPEAPGGADAGTGAPLAGNSAGGASSGASAGISSGGTTTVDAAGAGGLDAAPDLELLWSFEQSESPGYGIVYPPGASFTPRYVQALFVGAFADCTVSIATPWLPLGWTGTYELPLTSADAECLSACRAEKVTLYWSLCDSAACTLAGNVGGVSVQAPGCLSDAVPSMLRLTVTRFDVASVNQYAPVDIAERWELLGR